MTIDLNYFLVPVMLFALAMMLKKNKFTFKIGNQPVLLIIWKILAIVMFLFTFLAIFNHDYKYLYFHGKIYYNGIVPLMLLVLIEISFSKRKK